MEQFSLSSALQIDKPFIYPEYFSLNIGINDKYIVFHPISKPAKTYDYWNDALYLISKSLPENVKIIRIGDKNEVNFEYCINYQGNTSINNVAYILNDERCIGYLGTDTFSQHIASSFDRKMLVLFSSSPSGNSGPYFGQRANQVLIDALRTGKPSYAFEESPKTINNIRPEEIAQRFIRLMDFDYSNDASFKSVYFGEEYKKPKVMVFIPDREMEIPPNVIPEIRMDLNFDTDILESIISRRPIYLVTNKAIDLDLLKRHKGNIKSLVYLIDEGHNPSFPKDCRKLGIFTLMFSEMSNDFLNGIKIDYYQTGVIKKLATPNCDIDKLKDLAARKVLYYRSQKIFKKAEIKYNSKYSMFRNITKPSCNDFEIASPEYLQDDKFISQIEDFYFVEKLARHPELTREVL